MDREQVRTLNDILTTQNIILQQHLSHLCFILNTLTYSLMVPLMKPFFILYKKIIAKTLSTVTTASYIKQVVKR